MKKIKVKSYKYNSFRDIRKINSKTSKILNLLNFRKKILFSSVEEKNTYISFNFPT